MTVGSDLFRLGVAVGFSPSSTNPCETDYVDQGIKESKRSPVKETWSLRNFHRLWYRPSFLS